jgi:hypothetical protein
MFIGDPPGNTDRILDFSTAITGTQFFAPSADFLDDLPDPPTPAALATVSRETAASPEANASRATAISRSRLRRASARCGRLAASDKAEVPPFVVRST